MKTKKQYSHHQYVKDNIFDVTLRVIKNKPEVKIYIPVLYGLSSKYTSKFVESLINRFPLLQQQTYLQQHKSGDTNTIQLNSYGHNSINLFQMFATQEYNHKKINYLYLIHCMIDLKRKYLAHKERDILLEIHCPKIFGCDHGCGNWSTMSDLMSDCWHGISTTIYNV